MGLKLGVSRARTGQEAGVLSGTLLVIATVISLSACANSSHEAARKLHATLVSETAQCEEDARWLADRGLINPARAEAAARGYADLNDPDGLTPLFSGDCLGTAPRSCTVL